MYESKLGTTKEKNLQRIEEPKPKAKPKPAPAPKPRQEEKIFQKKKRKEYLDNYQYHETKDIKDPNPNKVSIVTHQRLGDIIGGSYEETTYQKQTITDTGRGQKLFSQQSTKTSTKRDAKGNVTKTSTQKSKTASRTLPAQSREMRREIKKSSNTNLKSAPKKPAPAQSARGAKAALSIQRSSSNRGGRASAPAQQSTRTQSAGRGGRKH